MITYIPDPYTTDFPRWADELTRQDATFPIHQGEVGWQDWASEIVLMANGFVATVPDPYTLDDWREWAAGLKMVIGA